MKESQTTACDFQDLTTWKQIQNSIMQLFLQTCTPNIHQSKNYFKALDFELEDKGDYTLVYDRQMHIMISHERSGRKGLSLIKENWESEITQLAQFVEVKQNNGVYYFVSPSGTRFALKSGPSVMIPEAQSTCLLGNYAGVSLETMDIKMSMKILQVLGFEQSGGGLDKGWVSCTDQAQNTISLMMPFTCPHLFINPSGTFFNSGGNTEIIAKIRQRGIAIYEEITAFSTKCDVDNITMREPGGVGFFVFND